MNDHPVPIMPEWFGAHGWTPVPALVAHLERDPGVFDHRGATGHDDLLDVFPDFAGIEFEDLDLPSGVSSRLYRPPSEPSGDALVWVHGGGFIFYDLDGPEAHWVALSLASRGHTVLSVDYTKAINGIHYPIPSDEILGAWRWTLTRARDLGIHRLHLGGASAGGNLAAGVVLRQRGADGDLPTSLILAYPFLAAPSAGPATDPEQFPADWLHDLALNYVGEEGALHDPIAFPGHASGEGFPPTFMVLSERDTLRPDAEALASRIIAAGGYAEVAVEPGALHGQFDRPYSREAAESIVRIDDWLRRAQDLPVLPRGTS